MREGTGREWSEQKGWSVVAELGDIEVQTQMVAKIEAGQGEPGMVAYISSVSS